MNAVRLTFERDGTDMKLSWVSSSLILALAMSAGAGAAQGCPEVVFGSDSLTPVLGHVRYLADDALRGRDSGSAGERCAADYIAARFSEAGLEPAGDDDSWFQSFRLRTGSRLTAGNVATFGDDANEPAENWVPWGFSASGSVSAPTQWIESGTLPTDLDLNDRIAVVDAHPVGLDPAALEADPHFRASALARRGAVAVVFVLPDDAPLPDPTVERRPTVPIPTIAVRGPLAERVREQAQSGGLAQLTIALEPAYTTARNVVALLPGRDDGRRSEVVIVGAHYDHLGLGGDGSLEPDIEAIHNGADDNASGTAALIEVARQLAAAPEPPQRPVLFIAFSGEERGLLGSAWFTEHPTHALDEAVAMLNMDMVGRLRDETLTVFGMATAPEWPDVLEALNEPESGEATTRFELALLRDGYGPSDHSEFYAEGIPVLHFFTNTHGDYHRPTDDWTTINGAGLERIATFVARLTERLAGIGTSDLVTPTAIVAQPPTANPDDESGRGYGPYFGSIPDMASSVDYGVKLSGVRVGSPAERAGIEAGDVLVRFGDTEVTDLYAFTYGLRDARPGDQIQVVVLRDGVRLSFNVVLGERR